jgi:Na+/H+-dicarboxylate symporter
LRLNFAIAVGLLGGLLLGVAAAATRSPILVAAAEGVEPLGTVFVNLLKMTVIPLVTAIVFVGVCRLGDWRRLGRMGTVTLGFFVVTSVIGALAGMGIMRALLPFASDAAAQATAPAGTAVQAMPGFVAFMLDLIPENPFAAAADGALLPLLVFTVFLGAAAGTLPDGERAPLLSIGEAVAAALIKLVHWLLLAAPVGVFALAAPVTARAGWAMLQTLAVFVVAVLVGEALLVGAVYVPAARILGGRNVRLFLSACVTPQVIAASATSSPAAVPAMLEAADALAVGRPVGGFVISFGAALGRAGSALFQGASIVFLSWLYGAPLALAGIGGALLATVIVSFTVPSIPGGSVVSLAPALGTVGLPLDGLGILLGVDRIPDMARSATNVTGTLTATVLVDRLERSAVNT